MGELAEPAAPAEVPAAPGKPKTKVPQKARQAFEPKIVCFICNWCAFAGANVAGLTKESYPFNVTVLRLMCTGRVDPSHIMGSLRLGADGVLIAACPPGDCHYIDGNLQCEVRTRKTIETLANSGLAPRVKFAWISASDGPKFSEVATEFTEEIRTLGPNPLKASKR